MPPRVLLASRLPEEMDPTALEAGKLAERIGGQLALVYVAQELSTAPRIQATTGEEADLVRAEMLAEIEREVDRYLRRNLPGRSVAVRIVEGEVAEQIAKAAAGERADYLVVGAEGRGPLRQLILGSVSQEVLKRAPCPVLVVPASPR